MYKTPPFREAIFEIKFNNNFIWDPTIPGIFYESIHKQFPNKKTVQEGFFEVQFAPGQKEPIQNLSNSDIPQFLTKENNIFVIIKKDSLSIHHIREYTSWDNYKKQIELVVKKFIEVYTKINKPAAADIIARLGLRYINKIEIPIENFEVKKYFSFLPTQMGDEKIEAFIVGTVQNKDNCNIKTQLNSSGTENEKFNYILNLDCYTNDTKQDIVKWTEIAHENIKEKFNSALTKDSLALFK